MNVSCTAARSSQGFTILSCKIELRTTAPQIAAICSSKTGFSTPKRKKEDLEALYKRNSKRKIILAKIEKNLLPKHHSHVSRCDYNEIYDSKLQNAIVLRMQLLQRGTLTQPCTAICKHWAAKQNTMATHHCRTYPLNAAIPLHKVSQQMQNTIAQHNHRREITWNHQLHCAFRD